MNFGTITVGSMTLWSAEQDAAFQNACVVVYENIWLPLQVPAWNVWLSSMREAVLETKEAFASLFYFLFITLRPFGIFAYMVTQFSSRLIWKYVIVQGISQQGVQYLSAAARRIWCYQRSLTAREIAMEIGIVVGLIACYALLRFIRRQAYFQRIQAWNRKQVSRVTSAYRRIKKSISTSYARSVQKIAETSLRAAIMTPHLLLAGAAVAAKVFFPRLISWLACETALLRVIRGFYPSIATILLLHDIKLLQTDVDNTDHGVSSSETSSRGIFTSPAARRFFPRTSPSAVKSGDPGTETDVADEVREREVYWLQFWMVSATLQACKALLYVLPFTGGVLQRVVWCRQGLDQLELAIYVWLYVMPYILPQLQNAPEGRPLVLLAPVAGRTACSVYKAMDLFTDEWWQAWVVRWCSLFLDVAVMTRLLSKDSADSLKDFLVHGKSLLLPLMTFLMPRAVSNFGLLFVQYCLPLQKQHKKANDTMLRYWVLHSVLTYLIYLFDGLLWWIPLSRAITAGIYVLLGVSSGCVQMFYNAVEHELEAFRILPSTGNEKSVDNSLAARSMAALLQVLPRASEDDGGGDEPGGTQQLTAEPGDSAASADTSTPEAVNNANDTPDEGDVPVESNPGDGAPCVSASHNNDALAESNDVSANHSNDALAESNHGDDALDVSAATSNQDDDPLVDVSLDTNDAGVASIDTPAVSDANKPLDKENLPEKKRGKTMGTERRSSRTTRKPVRLSS